MAYAYPIDINAPDGDTTPVSDLDVREQNLKKAYNERLDQVIEDFSDDLVDPKIMIAGTARVLVDTEANKPANADFEGQMFFAEDTGSLYIGDVALDWIEATPAAAEVEQTVIFDGNMMMAQKPHDYEDEYGLGTSPPDYGWQSDNNDSRHYVLQMRIPRPAKLKLVDVLYESSIDCVGNLIFYARSYANPVAKLNFGTLAVTPLQPLAIRAIYSPGSAYTIQDDDIFTLRWEQGTGGGNARLYLNAVRATLVVPSTAVI